MRPFYLVSTLMLSACASGPQVVERRIVNGADVARSVVMCETKVADLEAKLGAPSRDGLLGSMRVVTWIVDWDPLVSYLGVMENRSGTVVDVYWNLPSEVVWNPVNRCER